MHHILKFSGTVTGDNFLALKRLQIVDTCVTRAQLGCYIVMLLNDLNFFKTGSYSKAPCCRAQTDIKKGEEITTQYVAPDRPTRIRRERLRQEECLCRRLNRLKVKTYCH